MPLELDLATPREYKVEPDSGAPGAQPFRVIVSPGVQIAMDVHAHLTGCKVIGALAGEWDPEARVLR